MTKMLPILQANDIKIVANLPHNQGPLERAVFCFVARIVELLQSVADFGKP